MTINSITYQSIVKWFARRTASNGVRRVGLLSFALSTDIGNVRQENQDRCAVLRTRDHEGKPVIVSVVCDGMGGMEAGSDCAAKSIASFLYEFAYSTDQSIVKRLKDAVASANKIIFSDYRGRGGATLSAVCLDARGELIGVNVGDSRIYSVESGDVSQRSVDDTLAGQFGKNNGAFTHRNELIQFVGIGDEIEPHIVSIPPGKDVRILISSDGVHFIDKAMIGTVIHNAKEPAVAAQRLTELSKWCGGKDNATAVMSSSYGELLAFRDEAINNVTEIWDPYGEIQLITESPNKNNPLQSVVRSEKTTPLPKKPRKRKLTVKTSTKNKSTSSGEKKEKNEKQGEAEESEPQLDIEFDDSQGD